MSLRSDLLTSEQSAAEHCWCSHREVDKVTDSMRACMHAYNILNTCYELLIRPENNNGQIKWK